MNALDRDLTAAVGQECSILQFREDHEAKNERLDQMMLTETSEARKRIKRFKQVAAEQIAGIDAEIAALVARKAEIEEGTAAKIAAEHRRIKKARAYIAAGE